MPVIRFPCLYRTKILSKLRIGHVELDIPEICKSEAPVALRSERIARYGVIEHRFHAGKLWTMQEGKVPPTYLASNFTRTASREELRRRHRTLLDFRGHPFIDEKNVAYGSMYVLARTAQIDEEPMSEAFLSSRMGRDVIYTARNSIVIDGEIVSRSIGPFIQIVQGRLVFSHGQAVMPPQVSRASMFSYREIDIAREIVGKGRPLQVERIPEILMDVDDGFDSVPHAMEGMAWSALALIRKMTQEELDLPMAAAIVGLRKAMEARVGMIDYTRDAGDIPTRARNFLEIPDASDLIAPLQAFRNAGFRMGEATERNMDMALERARPRPVVGKEMDVEALGNAFT